MTMPTVVLAAYNTAGFAEGGGHFWVYLQYVLGLRQLGCDVYWLEGFRATGRADRDAAALAKFRERMQRYGLGAKFFVCGTDAEAPPSEVPTSYVDANREEAQAVFQRADLLLNFHYAISPPLLARFRRTALVDIDAGLLQLWITRGQLAVPRGGRDSRDVPELDPAVAGRVQLRQAFLHRVSECMGEGPDGVLPGERETGRGPGHRPERVPPGRRGNVPFHDTRGGGPGVRHDQRRLRAPLQGGANAGRGPFRRQENCGKDPEPRPGL